MLVVFHILLQMSLPWAAFFWESDIVTVSVCGVAINLLLNDLTVYMLTVCLQF